MTTKELAEKIVVGILKRPNTYSVLEARAKELGVEMPMFDAAMALVHKSKLVEQKTKRVSGPNGLSDEITYSATVEKPKTFFSHLTWLRDHYPRMTKANDGTGIEADYSYMFLSPEDFDKYKAELAGRAYVPKKRYAAKRA